MVQARPLQEEPDIFNRFQYIQDQSTVINDHMTPDYSKTVFDGASVFDFGDAELEHEYDPGTIGLDDYDHVQVDPIIQKE